MNKIILTLIAVFLVSPANADESESPSPLLQVGLALRVTPDNHQMLNYLYLQNTANNADDIIKTPGVKRMHMVNAGKGMSSRWLKKILMEDILINNDRKDYEPVQDQLNQFIAIFDQPLLSGDELTLETNSNMQTLVFINQQQVAGFTGDGIFNLMLSTWVGDVPPSRVFKQEIMGNKISEKAIQLDNQFAMDTQTFFSDDEQLSGL